jgi:hypothetical protein
MDDHSVVGSSLENQRLAVRSYDGSNAEERMAGGKGTRLWLFHL